MPAPPGSNGRVGGREGGWYGSCPVFVLLRSRVGAETGEEQALNQRIRLSEGAGDRGPV